MNKEDILKMEAGFELDNLVATEVMGYTLHPHKTHWNIWSDESPVWIQRGNFTPSNNITDAWMALEKLKDRYPCVWAEEGTEKGKWRCLMAGEYADVLDASACVAICKAALIAILENDGRN